MYFNYPFQANYLKTYRPIFAKFSRLLDDQSEVSISIHQETLLQQPIFVGGAAGRVNVGLCRASTVQYVLREQLVPVKLSVHEHVYPLMRSVHVPPLRHGLD